MISDTGTWRETLRPAPTEYVRLADHIVRLAVDGETGWAEQAGAARHLRLLLNPGGAPGIIHPEMFDWYVRSRRPASRAPLRERVDGATLAGSIIASHARAAVAGAECGLLVDLWPEAAVYTERLGRAEVQAKAEDVMPTSGRLGLAPGGVEVARLREVVRLIQRVWPEAMPELRVHVRVVVFFEGTGVDAFTEVRTHGALYVNRVLPDEGRPIVKFAEVLLHEAAHTRLDTFLMVEPMFHVVDPSRRYASPLRRDPRPIHGVFHQLFVTLRLMHFYARLIASDGPRWQWKLEENVASVRQCLEIVGGDVVLTRSGEEFVAASRHEVDKVNARIR